MHTEEDSLRMSSEWSVEGSTHGQYKSPKRMQIHTDHKASATTVFLKILKARMMSMQVTLLASSEC